MSTLNGVKYTEKFVTDEELAVVKAMRNKTDGCLKCEGVSDIEHKNGYGFSIRDDVLNVYEDFGYSLFTVQISYCPFCGKKL